MSLPRFGANYTPRIGWFHHWLDFSEDEIAADFDALADLGLDHVRVFAIWPYFQPNRTLIRPAALDQLRRVLDLAGERGLDVSVDGIQGHLSSHDFQPTWTRTWHEGSMFTDGRIITGLENYLRAISSHLADHPNFLGMSLGNEVSQFAASVHPDPVAATPADAWSWAERMLAACEEGAPGKEHQISEYDEAFFSSVHPFTPAMAARLGHTTTIHSWIFNNTANIYGNLSQQSVRLAEYLIEVGRGFAHDPTRPIWLQEIGAPLPPLTAQEPVEFLRRSIEHALDTQNLWGITWWCSHNVSRDLADYPVLEYDLGLIDQANNPKPIALEFARIAAQVKEEFTAPAPRTTAVVLDIEDTPPGTGHTLIGREACRPGGRFFNTWMEAAIAGERPTMVLAADADEPDLLRARGITNVIR